jgi:hypothetical protein
MRINNLIQGLLLISTFISFAVGQPKKAYLPYTKNLPKIDKIIVYKLYWADLEGMDRTKNGEILAEKTLRGAKAEEIAALWRKLEYRPGLSACQEPHYSVAFYSKGRLIVWASVCWACNNIFFSAPKLFKTVNFENNTQNFDADGKFSQLLSVLLRNAFAAEEKNQQTDKSMNDDIPTVSFCEMVKNPENYFEKTIRITATFTQANEGQYLSDSACPLSHDDQIGIGHITQSEQEIAGKNEQLRKISSPKFGHKAVVTIVGRLCNISRRDFGL